MSPSFIAAIGRCGGVVHPVSVRDNFFDGQVGTPLRSAPRLATPLERGTSVSAWLDANPRIRDAISWEHEGVLGLGSQSHAYRDWQPVAKDTLQRWVDRLAGCTPGSITDPPTNRVSGTDGSNARQRYSNVDAFQWYIGLLAHTLVVEMGRWVPWSLNELDDAGLYSLLDSRATFAWQLGDSYEVVFRIHAPSTPAEPRFVYEFLYGNDLVGTTRLETIERLVDWCRWNMRHFNAHRTPEGESIGGDSTMLSMDLHWQYRGFPPVRRIVDGTTRTPGDYAHWTRGCHGTSGFLRSILRVVNIPVLYLRQCSHATPHFMSEGLYLSHGDDPYNRCAKRSDLPPGDLLIDRATYDRYFGPGADPCDGVGQTVREATARLPRRPDVDPICYE